MKNTDSNLQMYSSPADSNLLCLKAKVAKSQTNTNSKRVHFYSPNYNFVSKANDFQKYKIHREKMIFKLKEVKEEQAISMNLMDSQNTMVREKLHSRLNSDDSNRFLPMGNKPKQCIRKRLELSKQQYQRHVRTESNRSSVNIFDKRFEKQQYVYDDLSRLEIMEINKEIKQKLEGLKRINISPFQTGNKRKSLIHNQPYDLVKREKLKLLEKKKMCSKKRSDESNLENCLLGMSKIIEPKFIDKEKLRKQMEKQLLQKEARDTKTQQSIRPVNTEEKRSSAGVTIQDNEYNLKRKNFNKKDHFVFGLEKRVTCENKVELYRDFLWKINYSNGLFIEGEIELEKHYKVYVGPGLLKRRFWWTLEDKITEQTNLVWTQLKNPSFSNSQVQSKKKQMPKSDPLESSTTEISELDLSQKQITLKMDAQKQKQCSFHELIFTGEDLAAWTKYYERNKKIEEEFSDKIYARRTWLLKNKSALRIDQSYDLKVHNHFNQNCFIGNKKAMFYSMRKYYELLNKNVFDYLPLTFHVSKGIHDPQYKKFIAHYNKLQEAKRINKNIKNVWIVKPGEFTNRGQGITVCESLDDVIVRLKGKEKNANGKYRTFIVQKYLQRPLLYYRRKFDIRHYMMMTCINGSFKGYWYAEGYIRTTSYEFNLKNCRNNYIHLTNDAIQKNGESYGKFEKGNKISYSEFQKYLDTYYKKQKVNFQLILSDMERIAADAMRSTYFLLDPDRKHHNFEVFGMDFMIDQQFHPWLIEINTNPCLQLSSPLLARIIPNMLQNAFKLAIDPLFQPPYNWPYNKKYQLGENPLENNRFKLIFDEATEGQQIQQLFRNVQKIDKNMGDISQQDEQYEDEGKQWNEQL